MPTSKVNQNIGFRSSVRDFLLLCVLFAFITIYANWFWFTGESGMAAYIPPFDPDYNHAGQQHLGGEYFNIAEAIYEGRGFSNPFRDLTGPTAWSPPILPYIMAGMLWISDGVRGGVVACFMVMQVLILALTGAIAMNIGRRFRAKLLAEVAILIVLTYNFEWRFQTTHDGVFQMFWVNITLLGLWVWAKPPRSIIYIVGWGFFGGLCALAGPVAGFAWAASTTCIWGRAHWKSVALVAIVSIVTVAPWVAYQSMRLDTFVPIKSNGAFEFYQGVKILPHGLINTDSFRKHPYHKRSRDGKCYRQIGEAAYLKDIKNRIAPALKGKEIKNIQKIGYRIMAATIWAYQKVDFKRDPWPFYILLVLMPLPFFGFLLLLFRRRFAKMLPRVSADADTAPSDQWMLPAILCFVFYLLPYMFISYYERYGMPITLPRILFTFWLLYTLKHLLEPVSRRLGWPKK